MLKLKPGHLVFIKNQTDSIENEYYLCHSMEGSKLMLDFYLQGKNQKNLVVLLNW